MIPLTEDRAKEIISLFKIKPKAIDNADTGSYYDYLFKCGHYYNSKNDVLKLLIGKEVRGTGVDFLLTHIKAEYPNIYKDLKTEMSL